jgi:hypothetical protein
VRGGQKLGVRGSSRYARAPFPLKTPLSGGLGSLSDGEGSWHRRRVDSYILQGWPYSRSACSPSLSSAQLLTASPGQDFPPSFPSTVKHIYRQLLRVFAHIYHAHYAQILHLRSEPHFNSLFAHFLAFGSEFELLEMKDLRGSSSSPVGVGSLWERWKGMGILGG